MKKFIITLTAVFCLAMVLPASAEVQVSGMIGFDAYINYQNEALKAGGVAQGAVNNVESETTTQMNTYTYTNYLRFRYTSKDGTYGAETGIYMGRRNQDSFPTGEPSALAWVLDVMSNNIWWKPMPDVTLRLGNQAQIIGGIAPPGLLGSLDVIVVGITGGNMAHTSNRHGITATIKINDNIGLELGAYDPDDDGFPTLSNIPNSMGGTADEENVIPRLDIGLPITLGNFWAKPALSWMTKNYENVAAGSDDSYDAWMASVSGRYTYGPVTFTGELTYAENAGGTNYAGPYYGSPRTYLDAANNTKIADTEGLGWWLNVAWTINPKMNLNLFYGTQNEESDGSPLAVMDAAEYDADRSHYGFRFNYYIASNFLMIPSWIHWDYGDDNVIAGARTDNGSEDVIGVGFLVIF